MKLLRLPNLKNKEEDERREYAGLTPAERFERFWQISALAWEFFSQNPFQERARDFREERSQESVALWRRLMKERPYGRVQQRGQEPHSDPKI